MTETALPVMISAGPLILRFLFEGDRFWPTLSVAHGEQEQTLLTASRTENAEEIWPTTPPWQEVFLQGAGDSLFALGKAGTSHWSLCVEASPARQELRFDVACRLKQPPDWLGCTYLVPNGNSGLVVAGDKKEMALSPLPSKCGQLVCTPWGESLDPRATLPADPNELGIAGDRALLMDVTEQRACNVELQQGMLRVTPCAADGPFPNTVRWRYRLQWVNGQGDT